MPLFEKCNVLLSLMTNNSSMNRIFHIQFHLHPNFLCQVYPSSLPNLVRLQTEKFLVLPTKSWNDTNTSSKFTIFLDDKIRATVQLITYIVPQNCLSIFTILQITINTVLPLSVLAQRLSFRFFFSFFP